MRIYSFGPETVPVAIAKDLIVGSVHDGRNYKIMLARVDGEEMVEIRFLAGKNDWEGHSAAKLADGYLIGGAVEGRATPDGGNGWKAYVARLDESLNVLWERKIEIRNNGAVYSIVPSGDTVFIAGDTGSPGNRGFFLGTLSLDGELLWLRDFGSWEDAMLTTLLPPEDGLRLIGSVKTRRWEVRAFEFDSSGELLGEEALAEGIALTASVWRGKLVLAGYRGEGFWVRIGKENFKLREGAATSVLALENRLLIGGEIEGNAVLLGPNFNGKLLEKRLLWENGSVEALGENLALGVKEEGKKMVIHSLPL
ncbi:hypothetical protein E3E36_01685 [Thermococcus sp. M36]|uniref:hypothetical protein n=1 Tax=Thermococcus sp. M36 TaxID=1638261 RepID=UPI00143B2BBC|nr:hypothetical protein [Thermococcus sp. M36]NJE04880.1 hypothetical protein [Thermococcus sp. M36]